MSSLGAELDDVMASFERRISNLSTLLSFRGLDSTSGSALAHAELQISALESEVAAARGAILSEAELLAEAAALQRRASVTAEELVSLRTRLPELLPGDAPPCATPAAREPLAQLGHSNGGTDNAVPPPPPPPPPPAAAASASARSRPTARAPPPLPLVTESELATAPSYMRSRLDVAKAHRRPAGGMARPCATPPLHHVAMLPRPHALALPRFSTLLCRRRVTALYLGAQLAHWGWPGDTLRGASLPPQVNAALQEVQKALSAKYALLGLPPASVRALSEAERKKHAAYKAVEAEAKGSFFFNEEVGPGDGSPSRKAHLRPPSSRARAHPLTRTTACSPLSPQPCLTPSLAAVWRAPLSMPPRRVCRTCAPSPPSSPTHPARIYWQCFVTSVA